MVIYIVYVREQGGTTRELETYTSYGAAVGYLGRVRRALDGDVAEMAGEVTWGIDIQEI